MEFCYCNYNFQSGNESQEEEYNYKEEAVVRVKEVG